MCSLVCLPVCTPNTPYIIYIFLLKFITSHMYCESSLFSNLFKSTYGQSKYGNGLVCFVILNSSTSPENPEKFNDITCLEILQKFRNYFGSAIRFMLTLWHYFSITVI